MSEIEDDWLSQSQERDLKGSLYGYLKDKAKRRAMTGNSKSYESMQNQFVNQDQDYRTGALLGALSEGASMMGTIGGKRAEGGIIPQMNEDLYKSAQNRFKNEAALRSMEDKDIQTDLDIGRFVSGLEQYDDTLKMKQKEQESLLSTQELARQKLRKELAAKNLKLEPRLKSSAGLPVLMDEDQGTFQPIPGMRFNEPALRQPIGDAGSWAPMTDMSGPEGVVLQRNSKTGQVREVPLPKGWGSKKESEKADKPSSDLAKNFESEYAKKAQIASVIDKEVAMFDELVRQGRTDEAVRHGEGTLKALNSAFGADAVGVEEAERLGGFLQKFKLPWQPGSMFNRDLDLFSKQLKNKAQVLRNSSKDSLERAKALRSGGIEALQQFDQQKTKPLISPSDIDNMTEQELDKQLQERGLIKPRGH